MRLQRIFPVFNVISASILALSPFVLFPVCEALRADGSRMGCYYSGILITSSAVLIVLLQFVKLNFIPEILSSITALICWIIPNGIVKISPFSLCSDPSHSCRASTMPAVGIIAALIIVVNFLSLSWKFVKGGK